MFIFMLRHRHPLNILEVKSILYPLLLINLDRFYQHEITGFIWCWVVVLCMLWGFHRSVCRVHMDWRTRSLLLWYVGHHVLVLCHCILLLLNWFFERSFVLGERCLSYDFWLLLYCRYPRLVQFAEIKEGNMHWRNRPLPWSIAFFVNIVKASQGRVHWRTRQDFNGRWEVMFGLTSWPWV